MGAVSFQKTAVAPTAGEGFDELVEEARHERGHNGYSGTISTCSLGRVTKTFKTYDNDNRAVAREHIRKLDNGEKYRARNCRLTKQISNRIDAEKQRSNQRSFCNGNGGMASSRLLLRKINQSNKDYEYDKKGHIHKGGDALL